MLGGFAATVWIVATLQLAPAPIDVGEPGVPEPSASETPSASVTMLLWTDAAAADDPAWASRVRRVQAELSVLGIEAVLFMPAPGAEPAQTLVAQEMSARGARLALWIAGDRDRAEVWRLESRRLEHLAIITGDASPADGGDSDEESTFAVRCAEIVHALTAEVESSPVAPAPAVVMATPTPTATPKQPLRWDLRAGASLGGASGNIGLVLGPVLGGGVRLGSRRRLALDAELGVSALRGRVSGSAGEARVGWFTARSHIGVWPTPRARVSPMFGLGGGVMLAWTQGRGVAPFRGQRDVTTVGLACAMIDVAITMTRRLRLRVGMRMAVALPPVSIDTGDGSVRTAIPLGEGIVALDVFGRSR